MAKRRKRRGQLGNKVVGGSNVPRTVAAMQDVVSAKCGR
jgi:hypothetical protein